jgi:hypothetical protein
LARGGALAARDRRYRVKQPQEATVPITGALAREAAA